MPRVVHFDLLADDPDRAIEFYSKVFGWRFEKWDSPYMDYWLIMTGDDIEPGIDGGLSLREGKPFSDNLTIGVDDVSEYLRLVEQHGGAVVEEKHPIPGVGWFANCRDTEGNGFGIMEEDLQAGIQ